MSLQGQNRPNAKLTDDDVRQIRLALERGERNVEIARRFNTSASMVSQIKSGRKWKSVY